MKSDDLLVGVHAVESALRHDSGNVIEVLVEQDTQNKRVKEVAQRAKDSGTAVHARPREFLDRATGGMRHQGVIARYRKPQEPSEADLLQCIDAAGPKALLLVLDGVQDPHNLGACLRSAAAASVTAVIIPKDKAVGITPIVRMASAGSADRLFLCRVTNLARTLEQVKERGVWVAGLASDGTQPLYELDLKVPTAIVVGGEGGGMRRLTRTRCDYVARIPMPGSMESLNVSVATGIALFEVLRQRG